MPSNDIFDKSRRVTLIGCMVLSFGLIVTVGCGGQSENRADTRADDLPESYYTVGTGELAVGPTIEDHVCALVRVMGTFRSEDAQVRVYADRERGHWVLEASGGPEAGPTARASMNCTDRSNFPLPGSGDAEEFFTTEEVAQQGGGYSQTELAPAQCLTPLNGVGGDMNDVKVPHLLTYGSGSESPKVTLGSDENSTRAWFTVYGPNQNSETCVLDGDYAKSQSQKVHEKRTLQVPVEEAFCFFTELQGDLSHVTDGAWIDKTDGKWTVHKTAACEYRKGIAETGRECLRADSVGVTAECVEFE